MILLIALVAAACSGGSDEPADNDGSLIGVIDGGEIETIPDETSGDTVEPPGSTDTSLDCAPDEVCRIEVTLTQVALETTPSSIWIDGESATYRFDDEATMTIGLDPEAA